jgi:hypothetical protein
MDPNLIGNFYSVNIFTREAPGEVVAPSGPQFDQVAQLPSQAALPRPVRPSVVASPPSSYG